jgi:hypothetical protein
MANLKFSLQPQASAHICVQCFKEVLNFRSGNEGYENVSNRQSPRGHPPWWGTETKQLDFEFRNSFCPRGHPPWWGTGCLGSWEAGKLGR